MIYIVGAFLLIWRKIHKNATKDQDLKEYQWFLDGIDTIRSKYSLCILRNNILKILSFSQLHEITYLSFHGFYEFWNQY